jgi:cation:H+ antiporter
MLIVSGRFTIGELERLITYTGLGKLSVGFVILAVMTSLPEVSVAIFSILQGNPGLSIGDIFGSNVFNMGLVVGVIAVSGFFKKCCSDLLVELTDLLFLITLIPLLLLISGYEVFQIPSIIIGGILLAAFSINTFLMFRRKTPPVEENKRTNVGKAKLARVIIILAASLAVLILSARLIVYSGINIATSLGISDVVIGAKIVAVGTSLPELAVGFLAAKRGNIPLAVGNIIGSNLTNLTLVLGLILLTVPFIADLGALTEIMPFLIISTIIFWRSILRGGVSRVSGIALILTYVVFAVVLV